ncbi:expressed unknown protein [Seminavis robusta]|uniref:Uncharacterized protein n=1 Tax=Seminavis robusta TaxID=568900 RepID=A0A9N8HVM4_9STRA|nr:expressed unknown protein [Seminavis robusta]|eukprot:Sro1525_g279700.1 n/a (309) ;mRNA; r:19584-20510
MMSAISVSTFWAILSLVIYQVESFPSAVGACPGGQPAVENSFHTVEGKEITTGLLSDANLVVSLNGAPLMESIGDDTTTEETGFFPVGEENILEISSDDDSVVFRGFLMRVGHPPTNVVDLRQSIAPVSSNDTLTQVSEVQCVDTEQVGGLMHTSNDDKASVAGSLFVNGPVEGILLDVTVVLVNDATTSVYYYSRFLLNAVGVKEDTPEDATSESITLPEDSEKTSMPSVAADETPAASTNATNSSGIGVGEEGEDLPSTTDESTPSAEEPTSAAVSSLVHFFRWRNIRSSWSGVLVLVWTVSSFHF